MTKTSGVVEINGTRYDLVPTQIAGVVGKAAHQVRNAPSGVIDGFTIAGKRSTFDSIKHRGSTPLATSAAPKKGHPKRLKPAAQSVHKRAQKSYTLMRQSVKKSSGRPAESNIQPEAKNTSRFNEHRSKRARAVLKNTNVRRFGHSPTTSSSQIPRRHTTKGADQVDKAARAKVAGSTSETHKPLSPAGLSNRQLERLLDQALTRADAHKKTHPKANGRPWSTSRLTPKWLGVGAILLIVILLSGFFAWQNVPQIAIRMAATRANIPASVPGYTPSGFSFSGPISYSSDKVTINFKANSDSFRKYSITQQKSPMASKELEADGLPSAQHVQTSQVAGTTVYIYGPSNDATWVNNGVLYTLKDSAMLTSDQILKIVGSM